MTNEELVERIQAGEQDLLIDLWNQVERLVSWKAKSTMNEIRWLSSGVSFDDLYNSGYLAMVDAVNTYKPIGMAFHSWFIFYLQTAFAVATGYRTQKAKNDPIRNAISLSSPVGDDDNDGSLSDITPDPGSELLIESIEDKIMQEQLHKTMEATLNALPQDQREILQRRYYHCQTAKDAARDLGITAEEVLKIERKGIRILRRPEYAKHLRPFYEFNYFYGTGLQSYLNTGLSIQDRYLIHDEDRTRNRPE